MRERLVANFQHQNITSSSPHRHWTSIYILLNPPFSHITNITHMKPTLLSQQSLRPSSPQCLCPPLSLSFTSLVDIGMNIIIISSSTPVIGIKPTPHHESKLCVRRAVLCRRAFSGSVEWGAHCDSADEYFAYADD